MHILTSLLIAFLAFSPFHAHAQDLISIELIPQKNIIQPGETVRIGIQQNIAEGWHTYWKNSGDSGSAPRAKWTLPAGFKISDIQWPVPQKIAYGPLLNYGYENGVVLFQDLTIPSSIPNAPITLTADIEILVCKEECIPQFLTQTITLNDPTQSVVDHTEFFQTHEQKLPQDTIKTAHFNQENNDFLLWVPIHDTIKDTPLFFPKDWGIVDNAASVEIITDQNNLIFRQRRGDRPLHEINTLHGLVSYTTLEGKAKSFHIQARRGVISLPKQNEPTQDQIQSLTLIGALLFAFIGGMILNLMPCVFPVLSLKALTLVKISEKSPKLARAHGLSYTFGVVLSFVSVAAVLISLKAAGTNVGWGFQLQDPVVVCVLAYLLFVIGLNLFGFFDISLHRAGNIGQKLTHKAGLSGSFFTGVLATIVAAPCTAPFMAAALGYALVQPPHTGLLIFALLGLGLATPYLLLSFVPAFQKILPKSGAWMNTFKQALAFPMLASSAWLVWVLSQQAGPMGVLGILFGGLSITFGLWLLRHRPTHKIWRFIITIIALMAFTGAIGFLPVQRTPLPLDKMVTDTEQFGSVYSEEALSDALKGNDPVFVEMTAAWCITCKVNHKTSINIDSTKQLFNYFNVTYMIGDWTNQNPVITKFLNDYGRNGVPIYVFYGARHKDTGLRPEPQVLPQVLTPGTIRALFKNKK